MYETFFGLKRRPFLAVPDTESYFSVPQMEQAREAIDRSVRRGEGISLIFGPSGIGKTLLLRMLKKSLEVEYTVSLVANGRLETPKAFFQQLLYDLRLPFAGAEETELRLQLSAFAREETTPGIALLIDEAQYLSHSVLEEIRLLMNCDDGAVPFFRAVLAGTVEFEEMLIHPQLETFNQRVVSRTYLESLTREETAQYITWQTSISRGERESMLENRLGADIGLAEFINNSPSVAGRRLDAPHIKGSKPIFTDNAKRQIFQLTDGLPRLINQLCDTAMQLAAERVTRHVDEILIHSAWARLQQIRQPVVEDSVAQSAETPLPTVMEDIDEIVARKKSTFQLKPFDSSVEFGTLEDVDVKPTSVYKPPYPEFDDDEFLDENEMDTEPEAMASCSDDVELMDEIAEPVDDDFLDETETDTEPEAMVSCSDDVELTDEIAEPVDDDFLDETETDTEPEAMASCSGDVELTDEIAEPADEEFLDETETDTEPEAMASGSDDVELTDEIEARCSLRPILRPVRRRHNAPNIPRIYQRNKSPKEIRSEDPESIRLSLRRLLSLSLTFRRFETNGSWIGNICTRILFTPVTISFVPDQEPATEEIVTTTETAAETEEPSMDQETLEQYGAEVLDGRPPFIRKEPNYAYQTTETAPERGEQKETCPYPDRQTGNVIQLCWRGPDNPFECGTGTVYSEYAEREKPETKSQPISDYYYADTPHVVKIVLESERSSKSHEKTRIKSYDNNARSGIEESFDEIIGVGPKVVSLNELFRVAVKSKPARPSERVSVTNSWPGAEMYREQIEAAIKRLAEATEKIEQAALRTETAGEQNRIAVEQFEQIAKIGEDVGQQVLQAAERISQAASIGEEATLQSLNAAERIEQAASIGEEASRLIHGASERVEQAASVGEEAGRLIRGAAERVENGIAEFLPNYKILFEELSQFQKTVSEELAEMQEKSREPVTQSPACSESPACEESSTRDKSCSRWEIPLSEQIREQILEERLKDGRTKLLPFPRRPSITHPDLNGPFGISEG